VQPSHAVETDVSGDNLNNNQEATNDDHESSASVPSETNANVPSVSPSPRRSGRERSAPERFVPDMGPASKWRSGHVANLAAALSSGNDWSLRSWDEINSLLTDMDDPSWDSTPISMKPSLFVAKKKRKVPDPDTPNYTEAMSGEDSESYWRAMNDEIKSLVKRDTWEAVSRSEVPDGEDVVPGTWAFKCKRRPDGSFRKHKARFCVRGDLQKKMKETSGKEQPDTFAPVCSWTTVRLMLVLTTILGLQTQQTDFSNAFAQAKLPEPVYIEIPRDFGARTGDDMVLKLKRSLYGQIEAPRLWFEKLSNGLQERGFVPSEIDPCLFISKKVICLVYVDDCCWFARDNNDINEVLDSFDRDGTIYNWEMSRQDSISEFLGIDIVQFRKEDGKKAHRLTQRGLIDKVLEATGMTECNSRQTPTRAEGPLGTDANGPEREQKWHYASVVGMLLYLASNSRPDISFAVHQCARFTHNPKASHEQGILRICRYLQGTKDEGIVFCPTKECAVDCYVDADFAGLWGHEDDQDPVCVKSRTGYVVTVANCPLVWVSKLQSEVSLSTLESEYIALSQSMRCVIPLKTLVKEVYSALGLSKTMEWRSRSTFYEDNNGCIVLANCPRMTPRTKHIGVKYHFFRSKIKEGVLRTVRCDSAENTADIFTKGLQGQAFVDKRKLLCGW